MIAGLASGSWWSLVAAFDDLQREMTARDADVEAERRVEFKALYYRSLQDPRACSTRG
jgi:hypothetical protein